MHSLTLSCDRNDDALRVLVTTLFKCIKCKSKLADQTFCSLIANDASDLLANCRFYVRKCWS